jgi:hypothetical protein
VPGGVSQDWAPRHFGRCASGPVAQLDRVPRFERGGCGFKPCRDRHPLVPPLICQDIYPVCYPLRCTVGNICSLIVSPTYPSQRVPSSRAGPLAHRFRPALGSASQTTPSAAGGCAILGRGGGPGLAQTMGTAGNAGLTTPISEPIAEAPHRVGGARASTPRCAKVAPMCHEWLSSRSTCCLRTLSISGTCRFRSASEI